MEYDEAKRIRSKDYSLSKLITSNIRQGGGVGASIKEALKEKFDVGTRTKAKITGIKEKFDPLNIAKFMTFGSNFAPALLGRMTGRSQKDINHFSGGARAKPYESATKLGKLDGDDSGLNDILNKIYTFMKSNQEDDIRHQELQNNRREEEMNEDAKRHTKLLEALAKLTGNKVEAKDTAKKVSESNQSILDTILDSLGGASTAFSILRSMASFIASPAGIILGVVAVAGYITSEALQRQQKNLEEAAKTGDVGKTQIEAARTLNFMNPEGELYYDQSGDIQDLTQQSLKDAGTPESLKAAEELKKAREEVEGKKKRETATPVLPQAPEGMEFDSEGGLIKSPKASPAKSSPVSAVPSKIPKSSPGSAVPEESSNAGQQLIHATNENNNAKLADLTSSPATNTVNSSQTNVTGKSSSSAQPLPPVRNLEDTFQRMIMNSTKVV